MKKLIIGLFLIGTLTACNNALVTETEVGAVQSVLDFYGGVCLRSKGLASENGVNRTFFEIEISQSKLLEDYAVMLNMPASHIAYLFYSNLKDEKESYSDVRVTIKLTDGSSHEYSFPAEELKSIEEFLPVLNTVSEYLKSKNYAALLEQFDLERLPELKLESLETYCSQFDSEYGEVKTTQFIGYSFYKSKQFNIPVLHLAGVVVRESGNFPLSLHIGKDTKKIITLAYKF